MTTISTPATAAPDGTPDAEDETLVDLEAVEPAPAAEPGSRRSDSAPGGAGRAARWLVRLLLVWLVLFFPVNLFSPFTLDQTTISHLAEAAIFALVGLSLNVLLGHAGTISLGHQAFVGVGAFTAAYLVTDLQLDFFFALAVAALLGGVQALALGAVSLRVSGLYFALVTLAYGAFAEQSLFGIERLTGGEAGKMITRPAGFDSGEMFYLLCLAVLGLGVWFDWRLTRSKAGRSLAALRENPRVAASYGIDVRLYTLIAFGVSGVFAGAAGALFAARQTLVVPSSFGFQLALTFVLMTVVGGLRNRLGVIVGSAFFALLGSGELVQAIPGATGFVEGRIGLPVEFVPLVIGPVLLLLTITQYPGGIGQQLAPLAGWVAGRRWDRHAGRATDVEVTDVRA